MIPSKVHFVGSIGLDSVPDVFRAVGPLLGRRLHAIPDGEPGGRRMWIGWQFPLFRSNPFLKSAPQPPGSADILPVFALADGVAPEDVRFGELGYYREARASYLDYLEAREAGLITEGVRFQVCLPTPFGVIGAFCPGKDMPVIAPIYEKAMLTELTAICAAVPHDQLCIQWDVCPEMVIWDGRFKPFLPHGIEHAALRHMIIAAIKRLCDAVPRDVEMGIHLCYGDLDGKHFIQPESAAKEVELANAIAAASARPLDYIHMPVPADRFDDAFYAPLRDLKLGPETTLYLGLVAADGAEKVDRRIAAASKYVANFGIAAECGIGRARTPAVVRALIEAHAASSRQATV